MISKASCTTKSIKKGRVKMKREGWEESFVLTRDLAGVDLESIKVLLAGRVDHGESRRGMGN